jgi:hypothetical protein
MSAELRLVKSTPPARAKRERTPEQALRVHIRRRRRLLAELREVEAAIAVDARRWATAHGFTVRPRIEQLEQDFG